MISMNPRKFEIECEYFDNYIVEYALSKSPIAEALYSIVETIITIKNLEYINKVSSVPVRKTGGLVPSIKEDRGEIINLPDGSKIIPDDISKGIIIGTNYNVLPPETSGFPKPKKLRIDNSKLTDKELKKAIKKIKRSLK